MTFEQQVVDAKRLAQVAGIETPPQWANAERELKAAIARDEEQRAAEAARREREEAEAFAKVFEIHRMTRERIAALRQREAGEEQKLRLLPEGSEAEYNRWRDFITAPSGIAQMRAHFDPSLSGPSRLIPPGSTWPKLELAWGYYKILEELVDIRKRIGAELYQLESAEAKYPALKLLRS